MTTPLLRPWAEEFRRQLRAAYGLADTPMRLRLSAFNQLDDRLARRQLDRGAVLAELSAGIVNVVRARSDNPERSRYEVFTAGLKIVMHTEPCDGSSHTVLGVLDNAVPRGKGRPVDRYAAYMPGEVTLERPSRSYGPHCDLADLADLVERHRRVAEAADALPGLQLTPHRQTKLRDQARKRYGSLRTLLELAKQRAELGDRLSRTGTVAPGRDLLGPSSALANELVVRLDAPAPFAVDEEGDMSIRLAAADRDSAFRVKLVELTDESVVLTWPERNGDARRARRTLTPGKRVVVAETSDFRYYRHLAAIWQFLDERDIVGNWAALATLLCCPDELPAPEALPDLPPGRAILNEKQRTAVKTALAAPYSCLIQGPPGTGKTQVITATIARLVERGERVLLTAPTHVALDEVLRRLLNESDVFPIRLTWKDSLVDKEVRHLTRSRYDHEVAKRLCTPATSEIAAWRERLARVRDERVAIATWSESVTERRESEDAESAARSAFERGEQYREAEVENLKRVRQKVAGAVEKWTTRTKRLRADHATADEHLRSLETTAGRWRRALAWLGIGELAHARIQLRDLAGRLSKAESGLQSALSDQARSEAVEADTLSRHANGRRAEADRLAHAEERHIRARQHAEAANARLSALNLTALVATPEQVPTVLSQLDVEEEELASRVDVQERWFELAGMTGHNEEADRRNGRNVMGGALAGAVNLVCVTTTGFGGDPVYREFDYDTLIVDEASKVTGAEFLIPARRARRWVTVGDEKQLRPFVDPRDEHHIHAMAALQLIEHTPGLSLEEAVKRLAKLWSDEDDIEAHQFRNDSVEDTAKRLLSGGTWENAHRKVYNRQIKHLGARASEPERSVLRVLRAMHEHQVTSLFERCASRIRTELRCALIEQRRMPAPLAELVRLPIYGGDYKTPDVLPPECEPLVSVAFPTPLTFLDTSAQPDPFHTQDGTTCYNTLEVTWVADVCKSWNRELILRNASKKVSVSVLAFYGAQARRMRHELGHPHYRDFPMLDFQVVDSVDRIQGQQADLVIVSFCRAYKPSRKYQPSPRRALWLQNVNRLNVASTRARRAVVFVGHADTLRTLSGLRAAAAYYDNLFDLLRRGDGTLLNDLDVGAL